MWRRAGLLVLVPLAIWMTLPTGAVADWEPAQVVSKKGTGFGPVGSSQTFETDTRSSDIAVGANGVATALFFQQTTGGGYDPYFVRRAADAGAWTAPAKVALPAAPNSTLGYPLKLAGNGAGDVIATWKYGVPWQTSYWDSAAAGPVNVFAGPSATSTQVKAAIDGAGNGYAAIFEQAGIYLARLDRAAGVWSAPELIVAGGTTAAQQPEIAVNNAGDIAVTYRQQGSNGFEVWGVRRPAGASAFSAPQRLSAAGGGSSSQVVAIDDGGNVTTVFTYGPPELEQAFATRWPRDKQPEAPHLLSSPRPAYYPALDPMVAVDGQGRVTAAWLGEEGAFKYRLYSAERTGDEGFGFAQRVLPANEHLTDDSSSEPPTGGSPDNERSVSSYDLAVDRAGTATIVYTDSPDGFALDDVDIKAARRASGGTWTAPVSLRSTAADAGAVVGGFNDVAAKAAGQVDVTFVQKVGGQNAQMAARFTGPPPPSGEVQTMVRSFDGTRLLVHWCPAAGLKPGQQAPTILVGAGWGSPGQRCPPGNSPEQQIESVFGNTPIDAFVKAGYNVLTFDARGFWRSDGTAEIDSPDYEGRDMQALIDFIAAQPQAALDGPGDPRLGMAGGSYGGGIQLVTAALDHRVDAIAPSISWNSLVTSLFPQGTVKAGWALILSGAGVPTTSLLGVLSPDGIQTGGLPPEVYDAVATGVAAGTIKPETRQWFAARGPGPLLDQVKTPTLLIQGIPDTLFSLDEAHRNFEALHAAGTEVKMVWFCGGHGACERNGEDQEHVDARVLAWFDHYLREGDSSTGPEFEWVDENGAWHSSDSYPPSHIGDLRASGSGDLGLTPGELPGSGVVIFATPYTYGSDHPAAIDVPITVHTPGSTVVGAPQLRVSYTATGQSSYGTGVAGAATQRTYVYAQIVDNSRHRVVGNQATPIPITLDGKQHDLSLPLERIASVATKDGYSLQIVPQTSVYDGQRAGGVVSFKSIDVTLPLASSPVTPPAAGAAAGTAAPHPGTQGAGAGGQLGAHAHGRAPRCHGRRATIVGTRRNDVIKGTRKRDVIVGLGGNDRIRGMGGNDVVCGGAGRDKIDGGRGSDVLLGEKGNDRLTGGPGRDRLFGGAGRDVLRGDRHDVLAGGSGKDRVVGAR